LNNINLVALNIVKLLINHFASVVALSSFHQFYIISITNLLIIVKAISSQNLVLFKFQNNFITGGEKMLQKALTP
jgi:hypothetical protein